MTDHYAVIGHPIGHSKSPQIHAAFAKQTGQDIDYVAREIPLENFAASLNALANEGFKGINITVPFKEQAWQQIDDKSAHAQRAGAINTLSFDAQGQHKGDNTDGVGLCRDLVENNGITLTNKRILLLGAGGAARGVIEPLLGFQPTSLVVANRTAEKAVALSELFDAFGHIIGGGYDTLTGQFDVIINATAASLDGQVPPLPDDILADGASCYDMMYAAEDTAFMTWAKAHGATKVLDGFGMLVEQAAEAFYIWRGIRPDTQTIIKTLRP
jgi:shikimate dehydrogenase